MDGDCAESMLLLKVPHMGAYVWNLPQLLTLVNSGRAGEGASG